MAEPVGQDKSQPAAHRLLVQPHAVENGLRIELHRLGKPSRQTQRFEHSVAYYKELIPLHNLDIMQKSMFVSLFENLGDQRELECTMVIESPAVTHLTYRIVK